MTDLSAAVAKLVEAAKAEEREKCARVADQWAESKSCSSHDENPCCHVRTGAGIAGAIRRRAHVSAPIPTASSGSGPAA